MTANASFTKIGIVLIAFLVLIGVVMGDTHVPVAIEPDADRPDGAEVATFALG